MADCFIRGDCSIRVNRSVSCKSVQKVARLYSRSGSSGLAEFLIHS